MRTGMLFLFLLLAVFTRAQNVDVLHYKFIVGLTDEGDTIQGNTTISFVVLSNDTTVSFDLTSVNMHGKGMKVLSVDAYTNPYVLSTFSQVGEKLFIHNKAFKKGNTASVKILYKGIPDDGLIISKNKYGDRTFFADNWPNRAHHWIPCNDQPDDKSSFEFLVAAPSKYQVISNGSLIVEHQDMSRAEGLAPNGFRLWHWEEDIPSPTKVMVIGVAKFATKIFEDSPKGVPVSAWVYPQDSTKGFYDYALSTDILKFFSSYIAPYPYNKLANVQSKTIFGGMENASCIFYEENSITGTRSCEDLLAHEIAHQWFGDMATEKSFAHLWLSEGFATYFTDLYFEHKYGREAFLKRLKEEGVQAVEFAKSSTHPVVDTTSNLMSLLNANSYQKGAWVLHMLRQEVGDSIFHKIIRAYYNQFKGGNADTRDFETVAEKVSGYDLRWFFDQWLYRPGCLRLKVTVMNTNEGVHFTVEQLQKELYAFKLPVSIETTTTKEMIATIPVVDRIKSVLLSRGKVSRIVVDPDQTLLFEEVK
jgi:aminopeptidase N